jgi:hypothetical protein
VELWHRAGVDEVIKAREKGSSMARRLVAPPPLSQHLREFASNPHAWAVLARNLIPVVGALVECAWRMVHFQPQYPPVQKRLAILSKSSRALGAVRKKAIVAVARRLAVDL